MTGWALFASVLLVIGNGLFVALEFALVGARPTRIAPLADSGNRRARAAQASMGRLRLMLSGAQLGITMCSLGLGYLAEPAVATVIESALEGIVELPSGVLHGVGFAVALTIVTLIHMVIGEMVPKTITIAEPEKTLLAIAGPMQVYSRLFAPIIWFLNRLSEIVMWVVRVKPVEELGTAATPEELAAMFEESRQEGLLDADVHEMLSRALSFHSRSAGSIMVPREKLVAVARNAPVSEVEQVLITSGHSRLPVYGENLDDIIGYVHGKDLIDVEGPARERPVPFRKLRRMLRLQPTLLVADVLLAMRRSRTHQAVVVDRGRTLGIVTLDDAVRELVGEIFEPDPGRSGVQ